MLSSVTSTVFRVGPFRFFFFSLEEERMHVHVQSSTGEAKFSLEPIAALAVNEGMKPKELRRAQQIIEERMGEIKAAWKKHFKA